MTASGEASGIEPREWHVTAKDGKQGPLTLPEVERLALAGRIAPRSLAWRSGMATWQPCALIPELAPLFPPAPSPVAPIEVWIARLRAVLNRLPALLASALPLVSALAARLPRPSRRQIIVIATLLTILACVWGWRRFIYSPPHDDFLAHYLRAASNPPEELLRIEKAAGDYVLFEKSGPRWSGAQPMRVMEANDLAAVFGDGASEAHAMGLISASGGAAVLKVPAGWESESFKPSGEYFLLKPTGPVDLAKGEPRTSALPMLAPKSAPSPTPEPQAEALSEPAKPQKRKVGAQSQGARKQTATLRLAPRATGQSAAADSNTDASISDVAPVKPAPVRESATTRETIHSARASIAESKPAPDLEAGTNVGSPTELRPPDAEPSGAPARPVAKPQSSPLPAAANEVSAPALAPPAKSQPRTESVDAAQARAARARSELASLSAPGRTTLRDQFLKNGDELMKTSRERASQGDAGGAAFYAGKAEAAYRQGASALKESAQ